MAGLSEAERRRQVIERALEREETRAHIEQARAESAEERERSLREVLTRLVRLKDGSRDAAYLAQKPPAWARARDLLGLPRAPR